MAIIEAATEFEALRKLLEATSRETVAAAEDAAAAVYREAIAAAAPRKTGELAGSVEVVESKNKTVLTGDARRRVLVGPTKKKGFHGYFVEKGWKHPIGPRVTLATRRGRAITTGRRARAAHANTHSQRGVSGYREIPGRPWFKAAVRNADARALAAAEQAFNAKLNELNSKG
jgi:hypothetical protein